MANLLRNCEDFAVPYLDDIAIFSLAWDDHLKHLKDVFDHLRSAKLHIKPSKCQFAQAYVKYLGHLVGQGLRTPGELKVQVIKDLPIPTNKTQGRNRKSTVDWNSSCQNAFEELKTRLSENPVLYSPDFTKPFIIQCDASNLGIGVVLSQVCENEEHPIMFLSKKLSLAEQKYSTTEKECAAIIFAVQKLKCYLDGHQKFVIQTDHNPLVWDGVGQSPFLPDKKRQPINIRDFAGTFMTPSQRPERLQGNTDLDVNFLPCVALLLACKTAATRFGMDAISSWLMTDRGYTKYPSSGLTKLLCLGLRVLLCS
ncbi:retrovirus-related Pol polyprotein from transposon 297 [Trichonephila clavipes]|nr:retrovirus-related Pol polyprotein from transposon 297 [Trichonephila clavipes]